MLCCVSGCPTLKPLARMIALLLMFLLPTTVIDLMIGFKGANGVVGAVGVPGVTEGVAGVVFGVAGSVGFVGAVGEVDGLPGAAGDVDGLPGCGTGFGGVTGLVVGLVGLVGEAGLDGWDVGFVCWAQACCIGRPSMQNSIRDRIVVTTL